MIRFSHEPNYCKNFKFDPMMALYEMLNDSCYNSFYGEHECIYQISWQSIQRCWTDRRTAHTAIVWLKQSTVNSFYDNFCTVERSSHENRNTLPSYLKTMIIYMLDTRGKYLLFFVIWVNQSFKRYCMQWWGVLLGTTHSRLNTGECSNEESALPTGSIRSILLSCFLRSSSSSSSQRERKKEEKQTG